MPPLLSEQSGELISFLSYCPLFRGLSVFALDPGRARRAVNGRPAPRIRVARCPPVSDTYAAAVIMNFVLSFCFSLCMIKDATANRRERLFLAFLTFQLTAGSIAEIIISFEVSNPENSVPGSLKQTSFIIHYRSWQAEGGFGALAEMAIYGHVNPELPRTGL
jgi:hypothetical protein